jgi:hypothetical protein
MPFLNKLIDIIKDMSKNFTKNIKFRKGFWSYEMVLFDKVVFYIGRADGWGISLEFMPLDKSFTAKILNLYAGVQVL